MSFRRFYFLDPISLSRLIRFAHGLFSSYLVLGATALYSLASVPLALNYLAKEEFGLWVVMGTLSAYISMLDFGMMNAGCRLFIDHQGKRADANYGGLIKACFFVSAIQATLVLCCGFFIGNHVFVFLSFPDVLRAEFLQLFSFQCAVIALNSLARILMLLLLANQRTDLVNYSGMVGLFINFLSQWVFFYMGFGVLSLALGSLAAAICVIPMQFFHCLGVGVFPPQGKWGKARLPHFGALLSLGRDLFLVSIGAQIVTASQSIIIAKYIGLDAAAVWGVGLRVFQLFNQALGRMTDISEPAFAEMISLGELPRLRERYASLAVVSFSIAGWLGCSFASINSLFVSLWTHGKIVWPPEYDILLGIWMVLLCINGRHSKLVAITKEIGFLRYIYFIEGVAYIFASVFWINQFGVPGILVFAIVSGILFSGIYLVWRVAEYLQLPRIAVGLGWLKNMSLVAACLVPPLFLLWYLFAGTSDLIRLGCNTFFCGTVGGLLFWRLGMPKALKAEFSNWIHKKFIPRLLN